MPLLDPETLRRAHFAGDYFAWRHIRRSATIAETPDFCRRERRVGTCRNDLRITLMSVIEMGAVASSLLSSLDHSDCGPYPFRHWLINRVLPNRTCKAIDALPISAPLIKDTLGKRDTHNGMRFFFGRAQREDNPVCHEIATALQSAEVVNELEALCDVALVGSFLRIEYCLDTDGFWLEPHTDIGAKLFTMLVYLSEEPGSDAWGTDLLDGPDRLVLTTPYQRNFGVVFIPSPNSWHGFHRRPINGVRRSLIVNYVKPEWRSRRELAFADRAIQR
jgi:hypothetical protein